MGVHVGNLWHNPEEGVTFSGRMVLPYDLPAGVSAKVVAIPRPLRSRKEKLELYVEVPLPIIPEPPGPDDIIFKGEIMQQFFRPPRPPGKRSKILLWGDSGSGKTLSALGFPKCAYIDNHGSAEQYESAYSDHLFARLDGPDATMAAVAALLRDPGDRLTVVMDDATTYWDQVQIKWGDLFLKRLPRSKGHHAEFYTMQPSDWVHPKREQRALIQRLIALDLNVVIIARAKKEYAGASGDSDFMKVIGEIFAGERNLVYEFDYVIRLSLEGDKRFATVNKQRVPAGCKPLPPKFEFSIDEATGFSNLFQVLRQHVQADNFTAPAHQVADPVKDVFPEEVPKDIPEPPAPITAPPPQAPPPPPPITAPPPQAPESITTDQLNRLVERKAHFKISNEEWGKTLGKMFGVNTARNLTLVQADHLLNYLDNQRTPF